ncbi:MAG: hypothetical protein ABIB79_05560 [archaeon]
MVRKRKHTILNIPRTMEEDKVDKGLASMLFDLCVVPGGAIANADKILRSGRVDPDKGILNKITTRAFYTIVGGYDFVKAVVWYLALSKIYGHFSN